MILLDGKATSLQIQDEIKNEVEKLDDNGKRVPHLAAVLVGDDGASQTYVNAKVRACERIGFESTLIHLPEETTEETLLTVISELNEDKVIDGFIVQLPLPNHINEKTITLAIHPSKDVDGFHPENVGKMCLDLPTMLPATPFGIVQLLDRYGIETSGKNCVVLGRSKIVGLPISILLGLKSNPGNCTVTLAHSRTKNLPEVIKRADILIVALGIPEFVTADMVKEGVSVIDVGITRMDDPTTSRGYRLTGDVHFESVSMKAAHITPVPGGVGPMTIASLLSNTLKARLQK